VVDALQAWRGVPFLVAVTTVADLGDLTRVDTPRARMSFLGLIPSAESSGARRRQGALTNAGHPQARRALIEGAWASREPAKGSRHRQRRLEQPSNVIQDIRGKAHVRRCTRDRTLIARGTHATHVVVAMARARVGFLWAMATQVPVTPEG
jgi:transposase